MIRTLVAGNVLLTEEQKLELNSMGFELVFHPDEKAPVEKPESYEAVICNGLFQFHEIDAFHNLRLIQLTSAGMDRVPMDRITERKILIYNAENTYSTPMAEFAIGGILQLYKSSGCFYRNKENSRWEKDRSLRELAGKTALIIGTGNVGQSIAKRLGAFDCRTVGLSRSGREVPAFNLVKTISELDRYLPEADVLVLAAPLSAETEGLLSETRLQLLKDDATVVNVARGKLIDENALILWLKEHPKGGAVLDVFESEPLPDGSPLWKIPNVILSPHNSFVGEGNPTRMFQVIKKNLNQYKTVR